MARRAVAGRVAALLTLALVTAGCSQASGDDAPFAGQVLQNPYQVDGTALVDTSEEPFSLTEDTDARLTLVFYGYTNCPDICQVVMSSLASAMQQLDDSDRDQVQVVYITTDPARDTPASLRRYLDHLDPSFVGLGGDLESISQVGSTMAVAIEKGERLASGGYDVTHSTQVLAIDPDDEVPLYWPQETTARQYAADIHTLLTSG